MNTRDLFDETKIIKKKTNTVVESIPETENKPEQINTSNIDTPILDNKVEDKEEMVKIDSIIKQNPIFVYEKNQHTKKVETNSLVQTSTLNLNIPLDQLKLIYINTIKYINELQLEIAILQSLLKNQDKQFVYYKNKLEYINNEYIFSEQKKLVLEKLIK